MAGGLGNDTYIVDNAGDLVTEAVGAGTDLVRSALSHTLGANVENLILTGATSTNGTGNALANSLTGNGGANVLDGGAGADTMNGDAGNDTYIVDDSLDRVSETSAANGTDTVQASVDYALGANIENLILLGSAINGTGNALANSLTGNSAGNVLNGGAGADVMRGEGGDDTYIVDNAGDIIGETPGNGTDTVQASVGYTLAPNVENLILTGGVAINGTGNAQNNALTGNLAANVLKGGFGNDVLSGGDGNDTLFGDGGNDLMTGGAGADRFTFQDSLGTGNADHVADFAAGVDKILLENTVFARLGAGPLNANAFVVGTAAADASDRIIYDSATGNLYYDSDGSGAGGALLFATLDNAPAALSASDFLVI